MKYFLITLVFVIFSGLVFYSILKNQESSVDESLPEQITGVVERISRPAPDITYDYALKLSNPYIDEIEDGMGNTQHTKIILFDEEDIFKDRLESCLSQKTTVSGSIEWGYAESRVWHMTGINPCN